MKQKLFFLTFALTAFFNTQAYDFQVDSLCYKIISYTEPYTVEVTFENDWYIEYVVVHELTHLVVPNHNSLFEALMSQRLPRWRERRQQLNDFIASEWKY